MKFRTFFTPRIMAIVFVRPAETGRNSKYCFWTKTVMFGRVETAQQVKRKLEMNSTRRQDWMGFLPTPLVAGSPRWLEYPPFIPLHQSQPMRQTGTLCVGMYELMSPELYLGPSLALRPHSGMDMSKVLKKLHFASF